MKVIAFHTQHDANVAVADGGKLILALELERLFGQRYFESAEDEDTFEMQWRAVRAAVTSETGIERFDVAVTSWVQPSKQLLLQKVFSAREWRTADHHVCHALHGLHDAPFLSPLIISFDGGGNDGTFRLFRGDKGAGMLTPIARLQLNLGTPYRLLATTMSEVTGRKPQPRAGHLALTGKLMAYAALGCPRQDWVGALRDYYRFYQEPLQALYSLGEALGLNLEPNRLSEDEAMSLAATSQFVFQSLVEEQVVGALAQGQFDGLILTGGCALNVVTNQYLSDKVGLPIHVPPAPNDSGIGVGALWTVTRPSCRLHPFVGQKLTLDVTDAEFLKRGASRATPAEVVDRLLAGAIIGVAWGPAELGPRALGHRSILATPNRICTRERINHQIKSREWYRPVAPAMLPEVAARYFPSLPHAPYMSFAPKASAGAATVMPAALHVDGTARVQVVNDRDSLLGVLLCELERRGNTPVLLNTSFNLHGRPLLQRASDALEALDTTALDYAWIEGWLVPRSANPGASGKSPR